MESFGWSETPSGWVGTVLKLILILYAFFLVERITGIGKAIFDESRSIDSRLHDIHDLLKRQIDESTVNCYKIDDLYSLLSEISEIHAAMRADINENLASICKLMRESGVEDYFSRGDGLFLYSELQEINRRLDEICQNTSRPSLDDDDDHIPFSP